MKVRVKPAFRSRLLATGVSLVAFMAIVSGFIQESRDVSPEKSVKLSGASTPLPPEVLSSQEPVPTVDPVLTPYPTSSTAVISSPSPAASKSPSAKPTESPSPNTVTSTPSATQKPTAQPSKSAAPTVNPSPSSLQGVAPATPSIPVSPEVNETSPEPAGDVYTCMSPGGNTREPMGTPSCPTKWGYVLTQV